MRSLDDPSLTGFRSKFGYPPMKDRSVQGKDRGWTPRCMVRLSQKRYRECPCKICKEEMNLWFSFCQDWGWDAWWSLDVITTVRKTRNYLPIPDFSTFTFRSTTRFFCIYCSFGISSVPVTYFSVLIHSVLASEYCCRLVVSWYTTWHTIRLLRYYTLSEYYRGCGLLGSCMLLVFN